ncbi:MULTISPECIES: glycosyltransferase family 4 protein [Pseudomonas chlororaphis group]|nr:MULTISPECIES: glycosyltransferase family 4 protein [Pseudomonas chlororaphis group]MCO7577724.1 hypothetical protein [Pseudomonas protegens]MCO7584099.1 hypothetical protein [Pseudomonas chlororaphis]MCO7601107.1 hypothetical protein [Pseudomonas chlororaphis]
MTNILIISFSPIKTDPRVMRQIDSLRGSYHLTVAGFGSSPYPDIEFIDISSIGAHFFKKVLKGTLLISQCFETYYWKMPYVLKTLNLLQGKKFDCVLANDINSLPLALRLAGKSPTFLDAHEYSPKEFEDRFIWRLFFSKFYEYICKKYIPKVSVMSTVCTGIAEEYERNFGVHSNVVLNAPAYSELSPTPVMEGVIRLIHHGAAISSRNLELMIEMMDYLDERFTLDLMLVDNGSGYLETLKKMAAKNNKIKFRPPVDMKKISFEINNYDIGLFLLPPVNFNYKYALPNKFFEFIQARLAIAIGPSDEMARLTKKYNLGIISDDFSPKNMAHKLSQLTSKDIYRMKESANLAAKDLNGDSTKNFIFDTVKKLLNS